MPIEERVFIAGAGPVGLTAAANLVRRGVPVTVFEAGAVLANSRASTFHPPTLDMLAELGAAEPLIAQGLRAPQFQYRSREGIVATFDFAGLADATRHPFRVQAEQSKLTRVLLDGLSGRPDFRIEFGSRVTGVGRMPRPFTSRSTEMALYNALRPLAHRRRWRAQRGAPRARRRIRGLYLAGAFSGGVDAVRFPQPYCRIWFRFPMWRIRCAGIFSWKFPAALAGDVSARRSHQRRGGAQPPVCRLLMAGVVSGIAKYDIAHMTLYKVHQRVAKNFRPAACSLPATPRMSTIRSAAWA